MNAIEMAMRAMAEKAMAGLVDRLPELLANLPPDVLGTIGQVGQIAVSIKAQLDRIESRLIRIENELFSPDPASLEATPDKTENDDGRQEQRQIGAD